MNEADPTLSIAKFLMVSGLVGAIVLPVVSWPAALMCLVVAGVGRYIMIRGRPTSRWARGWTAFRHQNRER
jgi:hypothetical protein